MLVIRRVVNRDHAQVLTLVVPSQRLLTNSTEEANARLDAA